MNSDIFHINQLLLTFFELELHPEHLLMGFKQALLGGLGLSQYEIFTIHWSNSQ